MKYAKAYAALIGSVLTALSATSGILPDSWAPWVSVVLALATGFATFQIPNTPPADNA